MSLRDVMKSAGQFWLACPSCNAVGCKRIRVRFIGEQKVGTSYECLACLYRFTELPNGDLVMFEN